MAGNIGSTAIILFIVVAFLGAISILAPEFEENNMLDNSSKELLTDLSNEYNDNYKSQTAFDVPENNVTNTSLFSGIDDFARQYLENKVEITQKQSTVEKVLGLPGIFLKIFGVEDSALLILWNSAVYGLILFLIGLYAYKAIKTGEVDG